MTNKKKLSLEMRKTRRSFDRRVFTATYLYSDVLQLEW